MTYSFNIVSRSNGVGLDQDAKLIQNSLEAAGHQVTHSHCRAIPIWSSFFPSSRKHDANIFLERTFPRWFRTARHNFLIPNQERYPLRHLKKLKRIDRVLCKSHHALEIYSKHKESVFISFSSPDRSDPNQEMDYSKFLHLAGKSTLKGTEDILKLWTKHPEWPTLTLVQHESNAPEHVPENVHLISEYISNEQLAELLNTHGVHLCPSRSEGWGHYIVEAMSCAAVVVTTDAPPMNELVQPDRGILIPYKKSQPRHLGTNFYVSLQALEENIEQLIQQPTEDKEQLGQSAKQWYAKNDASFKENLPKVINQLLSNGQ